MIRYDLDSIYLVICCISYIPCLYSVYQGLRCWINTVPRFQPIVNAAQILALAYILMQTEWIVRALRTGYISDIDFIWEFMDWGMWFTTGTLLRYVAERKRVKLNEAYKKIGKMSQKLHEQPLIKV